jgi:hypothetical protein
VISGYRNEVEKDFTLLYINTPDNYTSAQDGYLQGMTTPEAAQLYN